MYSNKYVTKWYQNRQSLLNDIFIMPCETQHVLFKLKLILCFRLYNDNEIRSQ